MSRPWLLGNTVRGRPRRRRPCSRERGSGTVFVIGFSAWVLTVGFTVAATGAADVTQHRADVAAELAALSAVARVSQPGGSCGAAADIASAHGAVLRSCTVSGSEVDVEVAVARRLFGWALETTARARAGPSAKSSPALDRVRAERQRLLRERAIPRFSGRSLPGRPPIYLFDETAL